VRGQFIKVHWTMEKFINELSQRRKHLAFLMMPPGIFHINLINDFDLFYFV